VQQKKIVIFDMDGTLVDSRKDITLSVNYVRKINHNLPPMQEEEIVEAINKKERNLAMFFYNTAVYDKQDREVFEKHYHKQCTQHVKLFEGVFELLDTLKQNGVLMGVATNAPTPFAKKMLTHSGISEFFVDVIGADKANPKPHPQMVEKLLHTCKYNQKTDKAWMVGDNPKDIEVAKNANIEGIYATWGFKSECAHPLKVDSPQEILKIVL